MTQCWHSSPAHIHNFLFLPSLESGSLLDAVLHSQIVMNVEWIFSITWRNKTPMSYAFWSKKEPTNWKPITSRFGIRAYGNLYYVKKESLKCERHISLGIFWKSQTHSTHIHTFHTHYTLNFQFKTDLKKK